jgi:hypothetical protein
MVPLSAASAATIQRDFEKLRRGKLGIPASATAAGSPWPDPATVTDGVYAP